MSPERQEKFFSGIGWLSIVLLLLVLAIAIGYFGDDSISSQPAAISSSRIETRQPKTYSIFYKSGVFGPTNLRIHVGDTVNFQNFDAEQVHIVSEGYPRKPELKDFDSKINLVINGQYSYLFSKEGIFSYYNLNNPDEGGSVIVRP